MVLPRINFRPLAVLLNEVATNDIYKNNKLREYQKTNKTNYMKGKYPNYDTKTKQNITEVTEKLNDGTNFNKYRKEIYDNEKEAK